jgi:hypothetical protein
MNPDSLVEGQTILLPGGKLSSRDREILAGIGPATYRTYPVREGEVLQDIMEKRNITKAEMEALNPGVDLDRLSSKSQAGCLLFCSLLFFGCQQCPVTATSLLMQFNCLQRGKC